jgi:diaminopimelate epimerase
MVQLAKYHGTGNEFFIVDADEAVADRRAFAREVCDRQSGFDHPSADRVGADGVLFLALEDAFAPPRIVMTLVQPDGSIAPMCGNAAACAAAWAADRTGASEIMIDTQSGTREAVVDGDQVTVEMGTPTCAPGAVPVDSTDPVVAEEIAGLEVTAVKADIPHAVAFVDDPDAVDLESVGPEIRAHERFPRGANLTVAVESGGETFEQRTYKHGVDGEINSCGTGAVAVVAAARELGLVDDDESVTVEYPGGTLTVRRNASGVELQSTIESIFVAETQADSPSAPAATADD